MDFETQFAQTTQAYEAIIAERNQLTASHEVNSLFESLFEDNKMLTIIDDNGCIWFKANDIARVLEYVNTKQCIIEHVEDEDKITFSILKSNPGKKPGFKDPKTNGLKNRLLKTNPVKNTGFKISGLTIFINESGVNSLILGSKKPIAKRFKKWITSEVIPSIRMKGK